MGAILPLHALIVHQAHVGFVNQSRRLKAVAGALALHVAACQAVQLVEMRFFGGLSVEETAEVLKVSPVTVMRDWSTAKAWLYRELGGGRGDGFRSMETSR